MGLKHFFLMISRNIVLEGAFKEIRGVKQKAEYENYQPAK